MSRREDCRICNSRQLQCPEHDPKPSPAPICAWGCYDGINDHRCPEHGKKAPEPERVWPCSHISERDGVWVYWIQKNTLHCQTVSKWNHCPECGAQRPADKPRTLADVLEEAYRRRCAIPENEKTFSSVKADLKEDANLALEWFRELVESIEEDGNDETVFKRKLLSTIDTETKS